MVAQENKLKLINDPRFKVSIDFNSRQVNPDMAVWAAMHTCVDGGGSSISTCLDPVDAVIRHALKFGHWSVLEHASVKLDFHGFPHDTAMQFRTHQRMATLVQSLRYSDELYTDCAKGLIDPDELFYLGVDTNRTEYELARESCRNYAEAIARGEKKESARRYLLAGYRQSFTMSGTFRQWMHVFDQRLLADTQIEAQTAAWLALDQLRGYSKFFEWYRSERAGRNMLSP
jgi:flavin-dependent thymidylate synthase